VFSGEASVDQAVDQTALQSVRDKAARDAAGATTAEALEHVRVRYLGRSGVITEAFRRLGAAPASERPALGAALNALKAEVEALLEGRAAALRAEARDARLAEERIDVTLPGRLPALGRTHILTRTLAEIAEIFIGLGFDVVEGPEIERDEDNFERLNMPALHPARDAQDSFYLGGGWLLRTHTTVVDVHVLDARRPPMRALAYGRCYRRDPTDASHSPMFHQADGFMVGEGVRFSDLKGVLMHFAREFFGPDVRTRFVPSYFPFTEPSAEMSISCLICGRGCAVCKHSGWLEILGCGMFHPRVLEMAGIDAERHTAFAFGMGVERPAMLKHRIADIRLFYDGDIRFLGGV
jgi:phenylalanyl-tRNA synthetase alpha chain